MLNIRVQQRTSNIRSYYPQTQAPDSPMQNTSYLGFLFRSLRVPIRLVQKTPRFCPPTPSFHATPRTREDKPVHPQSDWRNKIGGFPALLVHLTRVDSNL